MEPYLGQISMMAFNFPPKGWAICNGAIQTIQQNAALYSLLGVKFGGNGTTNFALPDLRGRTPISFGNYSSISYEVGMYGGTEQVTLTTDQLPTHSHTVYASSLDADKGGPRNDRVLAKTPDIYGPPNNLIAMSPAAIGATGSNMPHNNMQPSLAINFSIAVTGAYPQRN
ncbi:phage tail protein [Hahella sp. KA22]|uniref:phage tail protein n=1 Tax=Hahella sp. KA22 TaxID=1628392 RepID=UPI000FDE698F|nr:tail fiber protein [Hahella sp. KA22]AZZ94466.1 phage tail protein [Hahella sp. KA22]QAY57839.1 phage tail protein [Hahella sp. KA22]